MFSPDVLRVFCARIARAQKKPPFLIPETGAKPKGQFQYRRSVERLLNYFTDFLGFCTWH